MSLHLEDSFHGGRVEDHDHARSVVIGTSYDEALAVFEGTQLSELDVGHKPLLLKCLLDSLLPLLLRQAHANFTTLVLLLRLLKRDLSQGFVGADGVH